MDSKTKKINSIWIIIGGIVLMASAIFGLTYAWFTLNVQNPTGSTMTVDIADLGIVTFNDGNILSMGVVYPGTSKNKTFTIVRTGADTGTNASYKIKINVTTNTVTAVANGAFTYTLTGSGTGTVLSASNVVVPSTSAYISGTGKFTSNATHTYTFTLTFANTNTDQNAVQGTDFSGYLTVENAQQYSSGNQE